MKIDPKTVTILKSFSSMSTSLLFREGNVLKGVSNQKTVLSRAEIKDNFPVKFAIYELHKFLGCLSLFQEPNLEFNDKYVTISEGKQTTDGDTNSNVSSVKFVYADESLVPIPPDKHLTLPSIDVECKVTAKTLSDVSRASGILGLPEIAFGGDGQNIYIQAIDMKTETSGVSNAFKVKIGETNHTFNFVFKVEHLLALMNDDYEIQFSKDRLSYFKGKDIEYWVVMEANSSFSS
jgi:hypothetical protein